MALQMRVYAEIASVEAKVMWGMGWRQLAASALMLVLGGSEVAVFFLLLDQPDLGSYLLFVVCLPPALFTLLMASAAFRFAKEFVATFKYPSSSSTLNEEKKLSF